MKRIILVLLLVSGAVLAQSEPGYQAPPKIMADLVDAPRQPGAMISDDKRWLALLHRPGAPGIAELAQPEEKLAGLRINPAIFAPSRSSGYTGIELRPLRDGQKTLVLDLPEGKAMDVAFSPDSKNLAFILETGKGLSLWNYSLETGETSKVADRLINADQCFTGWQQVSLETRFKRILYPADSQACRPATGPGDHRYQAGDTDHDR